jgi:hypothetical protein
MGAMPSGIAPRVLVSQVRGTAGWLWADGRARAVVGVFDREAAEEVASLGLMLAAHFATVGTFVPTDVDARIRHHAWQAAKDPDEVSAASTLVDEVASWDPHWVSARVTDGLSGHDGEWLAVRAGAVGRALALGGETLAARIGEAIDAELDREERLLRAAVRDGEARRAMAIATTVAHNLGDLSRVVEAWPAPHRARGARWTRLGHADAPCPRPAFAAAGALNKALVALENHRFLALRRARDLRASRDLLLPIGPWFDGWGETVARHPVLDDDARADVVAALLELHLASPDQLGCLRALAGIHRATRGGLEAHLSRLPARLRKEPLRGRVREALDVLPARFEARMQKRYDAWIAASPFR